MLDRVRVPPRSPMSPLFCSPPTPCPHWPRLQFPLPVAYLDAGACSMPRGPTTRAPATCRASETGRRLSAKPGFVEERRGPPRLRGHPLRACSGRTPRRIHPPPCPSLAGVVVAFDEIQHSRHPGRLEVLGPQSHGPHARVPTHRPPCFHDRPQAYYLLGRAHPWPGRMRTCWTTHKVSWRHRFLQFPLTHRAWSHWKSYPPS